MNGGTNTGTGDRTNDGMSGRPSSGASGGTDADSPFRTPATTGSDPVRRLQLAGAANHLSMFATQAVASGGSADVRYAGIVAYRPGAQVLVGFPDVPPAKASVFADEVVAFARERRPLGEVGWWTMDEGSANHLGVRLLARGFHWGWRPNWMALDIAELIEDHPRPAGLVVSEIDNNPATDRRGELRKGTTDPAVLRHFAATLDGVSVGSVMLHKSDHDGEPVGGIYDTEVVPAARGRGVGTALTAAACRRARDIGCAHVLLNATSMGEPVYRRVGFTALGEAGQTWWMPAANLEAAPPSRHAIALVEAIGGGDLSAVRTALEAEPRDLTAKLLCGLTPAEIAELIGQHTTARWLASYDS